MNDIDIAAFDQALVGIPDQEIIILEGADSSRTT